MVPTYHATDGPRGTLLIRVGWRDVGLINKPPELGGGYRPYRLSGEPLPGEHLTIISTALACCADSGRFDPQLFSGRLYRFQGSRMGGRRRLLTSNQGVFSSVFGHRADRGENRRRGRKEYQATAAGFRLISTLLAVARMRPTTWI